MADQHKQLSIDDQAAELAATINFAGAGAPLEKGGPAGDLPEGQTAAEGGFVQDAGGQVITADVQGHVAKGAMTGDKMSSEPKAEHQSPKTGAQMTSEPGCESGTGAGTGGNLSQDGDKAIRARKPGQVGVSGGSVGGGLPENQDDVMRGRKAGKVGISKAEAVAMGLSKAQCDALAKKGMIKADEEEEEGEEEEDKTEEMEMAKKGGIDADDLLKSLHTLEAIAAGSAIPTTPDRRAELAKGLEAGTLTGDEMTELADLMKAATGQDETEEPLVKSEDSDLDEEVEEIEKSFQEQFSDAEDSEGTYDVSPFLERLHQQTAAALDQIQGNLQKSLGEQEGRKRVFDTQLAKSLRGMAQLTQDQGEMIKSLSGRLEELENRPQPRRGVTQLSQLQKSLPSEAGAQGAELGRVQILDALEAMAMQRETAPCGERLDRAVAQFEVSGQLSKSMYNDVQNFTNKNGMVRVH